MEPLSQKPLVGAIFELRWVIFSQGGVPIDPFYQVLIGKLYGVLQTQYSVWERLPAADLPESQAAMIPRNKAIVPLGFYGQCIFYQAINAIAAKYGILVIEDLAQSFGAMYKGSKSCILSTIACASSLLVNPCNAHSKKYHHDKNNLDKVIPNSPFTTNTAATSTPAWS